MKRGLIVAIVAAVTLTGCDNAVDHKIRIDEEESISLAEVLIDAFYSFDSIELEAALSSAEESIPSIVFYQGWAEGGNYEIVKRMPCKASNAGLVSCSITVKDDLIGAIELDYNVTDTFELSFSDGRIISVETSSNDPQLYWDAQEWVRQNRSELISEPCRGFFDGGPTPGQCVRAMVQGYAEYAASDAFPEAP